MVELLKQARFSSKKFETFINLSLFFFMMTWLLIQYIIEGLYLRYWNDSSPWYC